MKTKIILCAVVFLCLARAAEAWNGESSFSSMTRAQIQTIANQMIDQGWVPKNSFNNYEFTSSSGIKSYRTYIGGQRYIGVAYGQASSQDNLSEFLNHVNNTTSGNQNYGNDCSGFLSICWKLPTRYNTVKFEDLLSPYGTSLGNIGSVQSAQSINLLLGDALNSKSDSHTVMFLNYGNNGINTMEQTTAGSHSAQRWSRSYSYLAANGYRPIRRNLLSDGVGNTSPAQMTSPINGSTLVSSAPTFIWNAGIGANGYFLYVGNSLGGNDIYSADQGTALARTVSGVPTDGRMLYVRLYTKINNVWQYRDYSYRAATANVSSSSAAQMTSPVNGSTFSSSTVTFKWSTGRGVSQYYIWMGSSFGASDGYSANLGSSLSLTLGSFPRDGRTIYVRLWSYINGAWQFNDYWYRAAPY